MKKIFVLLAVAAVALVSCKKEETKFAEEANREISFKAVTSPATKTGELDGTTFDGKNYVIYAAATQYKANGGGIENSEFFVDQPFRDIDTPKWQAVENEDATVASPIFWPVGGAKMDFLAYALPVGKKADFDIAPEFGGASGFKVKQWATYANQVDLLYAAANGQTSKANGVGPDFVKMHFNHAQALLIFNVKVNDADAGIKINNISFVDDPKATSPQPTLCTKGHFVVDNSRNELKAYWELEAPGDSKMPGTAITAPSECNTGITAVENYGTALTTTTAFAQLGETLLIPEQPRQNFTVNYTIGANSMDYTYNIERGTWEMGKKYIYNLDININEIIITETVKDFEAVTDDITIE